MQRADVITKIKAVARYLKETRVPVGEKALIERILTGAVTLEELARGLEGEGGENASENQQGE